MAVIHDNEFGQVTIRRSKLAKSIRLSVAPNGSLRVSMPLYAPVFLAKRLIGSSRTQIRELLTPAEPVMYESGMRIGKSHTLTVVPGANPKVSVRRQEIVVTLPPGTEIDDRTVQAELRKHIVQALKKEAKSYLPKRLSYLAERHGFQYQKVRFSHASTRWGSCSSNGTISLNIALMRLDFELIDYVLLHELCHTKQMNHSPEFWRLVEATDPDFKTHRRMLKTMNPTVF